MNELILLEDLGMLYTKNSKRTYRFGLYKCYCGKEFKALTQNINNGSTKSCGCIRETHSLTNHRLYNTWHDMIRRCTNPKRKDYINYGGRGIKVCDRWLDINNFINDMYPSYKEGLTLDRINVNGNYEPNNCRWATQTIQSRNTRKLKSTNTSGYRGVSWSKTTKKWIATIKINKKQLYLGAFNNPLDCAKARDKYIIDNNLEHARNF